MKLLPITLRSRTPVDPPLGYRWHMTPSPSIWDGGLVDLHLDEDPEHDAGLLTKRERRAIRALMAIEPPLTHIGTAVTRQRHIRRTSRAIVRRHYEHLATTARWQAIVDDFEASGAGKRAGRLIAMAGGISDPRAPFPRIFRDKVVLPTGPTPPGGTAQPRDRRYRD